MMMLVPLSVKADDEQLRESASAAVAAVLLLLLLLLLLRLIKFFCFSAHQSAAGLNPSIMMDKGWRRH